MDIPALSMAVSHQNVMTEMGVAVLAQNMETMETTGDSMVKMMEQSVNPSVGQSIDIRL